MLLSGWTLVVLSGLIQSGEAGLFEEDGVLVTKHGEVRSIAAVWQLVVITSPPVPPPVASWIDNMTIAVKALKYNTRGKFSHEIGYWDQTLTRMWLELGQITVNQNPGIRRPRRAPFEFIGSASSWLFGTVTEDQLDLVKQVVTDNSAIVGALKHNQKQMLSILNSTRHNQQKLARRVALATENARSALEATKDLDNAIDSLDLKQEITIAFAGMTGVLRDYESQVAKFHRQEMQLERGYLTEELLEKSKLLNVLEEARLAGFHTLSVRWYYSHTKVHPVDTSNGRIAFTVAIPTVSIDEYMLFQLTYLPIYVDQEHLRVVVGEEKIAIHTRNGFSFIPKGCEGRSPLVCRPMRETGVANCGSALATGIDAKLCKIKIFKKGQTSATVIAPKIGESLVAIAPHLASVEIQVRCTGKAPSIMVVTKPSLLPLGAACTMEGSGWRLRAMEVRQKSINNPPVVIAAHLPSLNLHRPTKLHRAWVEQLKVAPALEITAVDFSEIVEIPGYSTTPAPRILAMILSILLVTLLTIIVIYIVYKLRKWGGWLNKCIRRKPQLRQATSQIYMPTVSRIQREPVVEVGERNGDIELDSILAIEEEGVEEVGRDREEILRQGRVHVME